MLEAITKAFSKSTAERNTMPTSAPEPIHDPWSLADLIYGGEMTLSVAAMRRILVDAHYNGQRKLERQHVAHLTHIMTHDGWRDGSQLAFAKWRGRVYLVDGRHRLSAGVAANAPRTFQVYIEDVDSEDEIGALYRTYNVNDRQRSLKDVLRSGNIAEKNDLSPTMASAAYRAVGIIENDMRHPHYLTDAIAARDVDTRLAAAEAWWPHAKTYETLTKGAPRHLKSALMNAGLMAVALLTVKHQPAKAAEFWGDIAKDDRLRKGDARHTLSRALSTRAFNSGSARDALLVPATAWNAFFGGRKIGSIRLYENTKLSIAGTGFKELSE